jgi:predicted RNase H-like HicB family nuclease
MSTHDERYGHYSMIIEWSDEDDAFIVTTPELPGCRTHGATYNEAVQQGQDAIESWVDANIAWGRPIPPPKLFICSEESEDIQAEAS